jgi:predicted AlkP superfamily phosphohydrolase/phosphomutase
VMAWERLARAGKRTLVVDPYECEPPAVTNGVVLAGWQFENVMSLPRWTAPTARAKELYRLFGAPTFVNEVFGRPTVRGLLELRRRLVAGTDRIVEVVVHLLRHEEFDLAWIGLLAGHLGGHMFWDLSQVDDEELDSATRATLERALDDLYEHMDRAIARILAEIPDADVILTAPMGMGVNMSRVDLLPRMLEAVLAENGAQRAESRTERFLWSLRGRVPLELRAKVASALHGPLTRELTMRFSSLGVDWSKTPAFMLPSDHFGQVRLNVRGREREGIVDPNGVGELVERLRAGLLSFREPDGEQTVVAVDRTRDLFDGGAFLDQLPDLVVRWSDAPSNSIDRVTSPEHGEVRRPGSGTGRSGAHTPYAWALVTPRSLTHVDAERPHVLDIVPTICAALDVDPGMLRGSPLLAASGRVATGLRA